MPKFLVESTCRDFCHERGRRWGAGFKAALERFIERKLAAACQVHNGSKRTLDASVANHIGLN